MAVLVEVQAHGDATDRDLAGLGGPVQQIRDGHVGFNVLDRDPGAALLVAACEDPAKNKTKAVTGEAAQQVAPLTGTSAADFAFDQSNSKISWVGSKVTGKHDGGFGAFRGTVHSPG